MDLDRAGLCDHPRHGCLSRLEGGFAQHDGRSVRVDRGALCTRDGRRHDDVRGDAAGTRRERQRGAVITRRVRGDTTSRLLGGQRLHRVRRAPVLERADALQMLALEVHAGSEPFVERVRRDHRGVVHERGDALRRGLHIGERGSGHADQKFAGSNRSKYT